MFCRSFINNKSMQKNSVFTILLITVLMAVAAREVIAQNSCPCCNEPYRQFDFWIGEWEVVANDTVAGTNRIEVAQDSCVLIENWTSARMSYTGTSYNYYDRTDSLWHQLWLDNQGSKLELTGKMVDGVMEMRTDVRTDPSGNTSWHVIRWIPRNDGTVRQQWQKTSDGGGTWSTLFDGIYYKKD